MPPNLKTRSATSHLKRLARSLASLAEQDRQQAARLSAHLSLAAAGLCPAPLDRKLIETLNRLIHGPQASLHYDASDFAGLTESFHLNFASRKSEVWEQLGNLPRQLQYTRQALADPLFTGNLWEFLPEFLPPPKSPQSKLKDNRSKDPTKSPTSKHTYNQADKQANNQEYNQASYLANNLADTQFFTPLWIAGDMAASLNLSGQQTVLDPACGAGHLLVAVLEAALSQSLRRGEAAQAALAGLLKDRLFGLDVDSRMLDLSGLALYIAARKHCSGELPRPNLQKLALPLGSLDRALWQSDSAPDSPVKGIRGFDNLIMNPPYQSSRTMDSITADYLKQHYPNTKNDLYAAFLELALTLLKEEGRLTTITQQSFFSIQRFERLRLELLDKACFISVKALGAGAFPTCPGEKVNTAILTLEKRKARPALQEHQPVGQGNFNYRLYKKEKTGGKMELLKEIELQESGLLAVAQAIPGFPFIFDAPPELPSLFSKFTSLGKLEKQGELSIVNGLFTCNNKLFVKSKEELHSDEAPHYVPYDKGGGRKWYYETPLRLNWHPNGEAIRAYRAGRGQSRSLPGEAFYFQDGITYSYIGTSGFTARLLSAGAVFDIASSAIFTRTIDKLTLLAYLNSATAIYLLAKLNPTINFQIGDLRRLPFKLPTDALDTSLQAQAAACIELMKEASYCSASGNLPRLQKILQEEARQQAEIDRLIFEHMSVGNALRREILENDWVLSARAKVL